ncbi:ABC transporter permease subunit [Peribacillus deserti]|uniref:ABC transmembrane type-1 domain-containing protein n=1 Tax=Peribacillus deserti TaxID=673318 RepID=A0A2N5M5H3_9BACI|nr:ABC transporter permease subunit [Peribacillus deserti]PLT29621.1 hypothetical protein CUU66_11995 [Peribacillus deserti]
MEMFRNSVIQYVLLCFSIVLLTASPALVAGNDGLGFYVLPFIHTVTAVLLALIRPLDLTYMVKTQTLSFPKMPENRSEVFLDQDLAYELFPYVLTPFSYSFLLLSGSFIIALLFSTFGSLLVYRLHPFVKRGIIQCTQLLEALPDVFFIFSVQLLVVWIYKKTGWQLSYPYYTHEDLIFILPLLALSILPAIYLFRIQVLLMEEESHKDYYLFAKSKGLPEHYISVQHIFRNTLVESIIHLPTLIMLLFTNLVVLEFLFNSQGLMSLIVSDQPASTRCLLVIMLMTPFYVIIKVTAAFRHKFNGEKGASQ